MKNKECVRFTSFTEAVTHVAEKLGVTRQEATHWVWDHGMKMGTDRAIWLIV
jgi:hypothetical protein